MSRPQILIAAVGALGIVAAGCTADPVITSPEPAPTVTVTETVTLAPTEPASAAIDPCEVLVGGEALAFVFVTSPTPGTMVSSGFAFTGCSNVFEAAHQWELLDGNDAVLANGFGMATCGTGCVGTFTQTVNFSLMNAQVGTLRVFTTSAQEGSRIDLNSIPLVLKP
ncbi:MAG: hypothetical protein ACI867_002020 [Glaciecola sp.]|jgi:hypothetical protein